MVQRINIDRANTDHGATQMHPARAMRVSEIGVDALLVKAGAGQMLTLRIRNAGAAAKIIQFHDSAKAAAAAAVPFWDFELGAGQAYVDNVPLDFEAGLYIASSSTEGSLTITSDAELSICATVK